MLSTGLEIPRWEQKNNIGKSDIGELSSSSDIDLYVLFFMF